MNINRRDAEQAYRALLTLSASTGLGLEAVRNGNPMPEDAQEEFLDGMIPILALTSLLIGRGLGKSAKEVQADAIRSIEAFGENMLKGLREEEANETQH